MEQLICHLVGDYIFQSHTMAIKKTTSNLWALYHAVWYTIPFLLITQDIEAISIICVTHMLIDRFRIAAGITKLKNYIFGEFNRQALLEIYPEGTPVWLSTWLVIILDNTMHMVINYLAIKYA
jgi:hypothetical protein